MKVQWMKPNHIRHLASHIVGIKYSDLTDSMDGTVEFYFHGVKQEIPEPSDILLLDDDKSRVWIANHYTEMLSKLDETINLGE